MEGVQKHEESLCKVACGDPCCSGYSRGLARPMEHASSNGEKLSKLAECDSVASHTLVMSFEIWKQVIVTRLTCKLLLPYWVTFEYCFKQFTISLNNLQLTST